LTGGAYDGFLEGDDGFTPAQIKDVAAFLKTLEGSIVSH